MSQSKSTDFVEIFGGKGGVTNVCIRRRYALNPGRNHDIVAGIDLSIQSEIDLLIKYIHEAKPLCLILGPPCTAFGSWSSYNAQHAHDAWAESMRLGLPLAQLAARLAQIQIDAKRFFICENPWTSKLWDIKEWQAILAQPDVLYVRADHVRPHIN